MTPKTRASGSTARSISRDPGFVRPGDVLPAGLDRRLNAFPPSGWDAFGLKDRDGHSLKIAHRCRTLVLRPGSSGRFEACRNLTVLQMTAAQPPPESRSMRVAAKASQPNHRSPSERCDLSETGSAKLSMAPQARIKLTLGYRWSLISI
jgi:hypothetical protein